MSKIRKSIGAALGLTALAIATGTSPAIAQEDVSVLAGSCASCHGTDGNSPGPIASIAGRPETLLRTQLLGFKAGKIPNTTIMNRLAKGYTDEQLQALARHFSQIKPQGAK